MIADRWFKTARQECRRGGLRASKPVAPYDGMTAVIDTPSRSDPDAT
jgi:hypothetical protein